MHLSCKWLQGNFLIYESKPYSGTSLYCKFVTNAAFFPTAMGRNCIYELISVAPLMFMDNNKVQKNMNFLMFS